MPNVALLNIFISLFLPQSWICVSLRGSLDWNEIVASVFCSVLVFFKISFLYHIHTEEQAKQSYVY